MAPMKSEGENTPPAKPLARLMAVAAVFSTISANNIHKG